MKKTLLILFYISLICTSLVLADGGGAFTVTPSSDAGWAPNGGSQTIYEGEEDFGSSNDINSNGIYDWYENIVCGTNVTCLGNMFFPNNDYDSDGITNKQEFCNFYIVNGVGLPPACSPGCGNGYCEFTATSESHTTCPADCDSGCTETMINVCEPNAGEYFLLDDFDSCSDCSDIYYNQEGGGGGEDDPAIPEFTTTGLLVIILVFLISMLIIKRSKK